MFKLKKIFKKKAFTLVELLVVITILSILTLIAYMSIAWYVKNSRDSKRISDTRNISNLIEIYLAKWIPPSSLQSNWTQESFSWWILFKHWTIDESMWIKLKDISKIPRDPKTDAYYKYSTTVKWTYYQIFSNLERWNGINWIVSKVYAEDETDTSKIFEIIWNYNWLFLIWSDNKYYSIPSLFIDSRWIDSDWFAWFYLDWKNKLTKYKIIQISPSAPITDDEVYNFTINIYNSYIWSWINEAVFSYLDISNRSKVIEFWRLLLNQKITSNTAPVAWWCVLNWEAIIDWWSITAYEEESLFWFSINTCESISQIRTCNNWVLSWDEIYQYTSCVKWINTLCEANPSYIYNTHTYGIPEINHQETATWIISEIVSENNWIFTYTLNNISCNDWNLINPFESSTPTLVSCNPWFTSSWSTCIIPWDITLDWTGTVICSLCTP